MIVQTCVLDETSLTDLPNMEHEATLIHDPLILPNDAPNINTDLKPCQIYDIDTLIEKYSDAFSPAPGLTRTIEHSIEKVKNKLYPVPIHLKRHFDEEVDKPLQFNIIQPSMSAYCSPVVLVKKPDSSYRMTID